MIKKILTVTLPFIIGCLILIFYGSRNKCILVKSEEGLPLVGVILTSAGHSNDYIGLPITDFYKKRGETDASGEICIGYNTNDNVIFTSEVFTFSYKHSFRTYKGIKNIPNNIILENKQRDP